MELQAPRVAKQSSASVLGFRVLWHGAQRSLARDGGCACHRVSTPPPTATKVGTMIDHSRPSASRSRGACLRLWAASVRRMWRSRFSCPQLLLLYRHRLTWQLCCFLSCNLRSRARRALIARETARKHEFISCSRAEVGLAGGMASVQGMLALLRRCPRH